MLLAQPQVAGAHGQTQAACIAVARTVLYRQRSITDRALRKRPLVVKIKQDLVPLITRGPKAARVLRGVIQTVAPLVAVKVALRRGLKM